VYHPARQSLEEPLAWLSWIKKRFVLPLEVEPVLRAFAPDSVLFFSIETYTTLI
jgi:hypothetical protein